MANHPICALHANLSCARSGANDCCHGDTACALPEQYAACVIVHLLTQRRAPISEHSMPQGSTHDSPQSMLSSAIPSLHVCHESSHPVMHVFLVKGNDVPADV